MIEKAFKRDIADVVNSHGIDSNMDMSDMDIATEIIGFLKDLKADNDLEDYLAAHESDIAAGINDFDHLRDVFIKVMEKEPKE